MLGAFGAYTAQFISYIVFCTVLSNIDREFRSPLGVYGAVYGMVVFLTAFLSIAFFQEDNNAILVFTCYVIAVTVYYYMVVKKRQFFSEEEKGVLLVAHIIKSK
jgi:L-asparagine transporter-like permease